jgi:hypothetical protein
LIKELRNSLGFFPQLLTFVGNLGEPAFDLVQPRGTDGCEVGASPPAICSFRDAYLFRSCQDRVHVQRQIDILVNAVEEAQELLMAMARLTLCDHGSLDRGSPSSLQCAHTAN